jgi:hypothetical protein
MIGFRQTCDGHIPPLETTPHGRTIASPRVSAYRRPHRGAACRNRTDDLFFPDRPADPAVSSRISAGMSVFSGLLRPATDRSRPLEQDETCHKRGIACRV